MFRNLNARLVLAIGTACLVATSAWADSLELKNGSLIKGKYLGGTETEISFRVGSTTQRYVVEDVVRITFDAASRTAAPAITTGTAQLAPRPAEKKSDAFMVDGYNGNMAVRTGTQIVVPTGTRILVRTIDAIDSSKNQVGDKFQSSLELPLVINDVVVAPKGTYVYGRLTEAKEAGQIQGRSQLRLELTGIHINGQTVPLLTGDYSVSGSSRSASTAKRVGGGAALGAVIGAIAGGGKGAAIGAGVGAGAGTAVQVMTKGEKVNVPSETLLEFTIQQEVRMPIASTPVSRQ